MHNFFINCESAIVNDGIDGHNIGPLIVSDNSKSLTSIQPYCIFLFISRVDFIKTHVNWSVWNVSSDKNKFTKKMNYVWYFISSNFARRLVCWIWNFYAKLTWYNFVFTYECTRWRIKWSSDLQNRKKKRTFYIQSWKIREVKLVKWLKTVDLFDKNIQFIPCFGVFNLKREKMHHLFWFEPSFIFEKDQKPQNKWRSLLEFIWLGG